MPRSAGQGAEEAYAREDYVQARARWMQLAEKGDAKAMNNLGVLYDSGQGVTQDAAAAGQWFRRAAEGGNAGGMNNWGRMLEQGRGVPRDAQEAARW